MTAIQPAIKSIFSMPVASKPVTNARNPFANTSSLDAFNGKVHFGTRQAEQRVITNTHALGRLDTFI